MIGRLRARFPGAKLRCVRPYGTEADGDAAAGLCGGGSAPAVAEQMYIRETIHAFDKITLGYDSVSARDALWGNNHGPDTVLQAAHRQESHGYTAAQQADTRSPWLWNDQDNCKFKDGGWPAWCVHWQKRSHTRHARATVLVQA